MARKSDATLGFDALSIEGGLLSPVWLGKVAQLQAGAQEPSDYRIPKGLSVRDEIGRYWRIAQAHWAEFKAGGAAAPQALAERFVTAFLREVLGFASLATSAGTTVGDRTWPVRHSALGGRVPVIIAPARVGLETPDAEFGDEGRRRTAFGLLQEFLNAEDRALWGIASDGATLRIARDNASLTRPAWIEVDLASIFADERYADFAALWLLAHESRFGAADRQPTDCPIETWRNAGREEGTRARERLREGVEDALLALGNGFLGPADNQPLRESLRTNALTRDAFFQQLLRLVYRLIFLITAEERGVLHAIRDTPETRRYAEGYGMRRLRERSVRRSAHDRFSDLWQGLLIVFRGLAAGESRLALPALAGLFARDQCATLDAARLENRALLQAIYRLCWLRDDAGLVRVNWRDMGPEELGSVYESLLELVPRISSDGRTFTFAAGDETRGNARKSSGSYYTPDSLVQVLLDSALEPVVADAIARNPSNPVEALLSLSVVDPACGSGHFLLAAARRVAAHVARLQANGTPSPPEYRHALRQVVGRCIYGVDLNPMAVELCKVSLWMEAVEPGLPLTFLNSHIQQGNALLGTTPELMAKGVPDAAWEPIEGDDKKTASALKKRNKKAAEGQRSLDTLWTKPVDTETQTVAHAVAELDAASDANREALAKKEERWDGILGSPEYRHQKFAADAWCAAFVWPKQPGELADAAPTNELWRQIRDDQGKAPAPTTKIVSELADQYRFFHWHLQFPQVFAKGGFDVVLGNPPWDKIQLEEQHFFASTHPDIAGADARRRKRLIEELASRDPVAFASYRDALRRTVGTAQLVKECGRYRLTGSGNVATHSLFVEGALAVIAPRPTAALGLVVPSGLATQDSQKELFAHLVDGRLRTFFDFENSGGLFSEVHRSFRFALVCAVGARQDVAAKFGFFVKSPTELLETGRILRIDNDYLRTVSPNTRSAPLARTQRELDILLKICRAGVALKLEDGSSAWGWQSSQMFNETHEADLLVDPLTKARDGAQLERLYEAKLLHQFDHRYSTYEDAKSTRYVMDIEHDDPAFVARTRWLVPMQVWNDRIAPRNNGRGWAIAFRRIARATDERTFIATVLPRCGAGSQTPIGTVTADSLMTALLLGNLNSFAFDFGVRLRSGGTDLNHFIVNQLFVVPPSRYQDESWVALAEFLRRVVLELVFTAWDLQRFARDIGYDGPPFHWQPERRFLLRCELDAAFFHLYGLSRADVEYVLDTFPIVRRDDEKAHQGRFLTKETILEIFDAMAAAASAGMPYETRLSPPPADLSVAHPPREGGMVVPLPVKPAVQSRPTVASAAAAVPNLAAVAANAWTRPHTMERGEIQAVIVAVLKTNGVPMDRRQARLASLLCLEPHLLLSMLDKTEESQWARVVGVDAQKPANASIGATSQEWGAALTRLRGGGRVLEDLQQNTWALGSGTGAIETSGWPDGRAGFVLNVLRRLQPSTQVDALILKLPLNVQQWLANAA